MAEASPPLSDSGLKNNLSAAGKLNHVKAALLAMIAFQSTDPVGIELLGDAG